MRVRAVLFAFSALLLYACDESVGTAVSTLLFARPGTRPCVPHEIKRSAPHSPARPLADEEVTAFERDGSVILRGLLTEEWVGILRELVADVFEHPNLWDVLYSRLIANFYCAQKAILLHHTSQCGREVAEFGPTSAIAAALLRSTTLRVAEPTDALGNFESHVWWGLDTCGTTGFHTDDKYIPIRRANESRAAMVRLWIPLASFGGANMRFAALNMSAERVAERAAAGLSALNGTSYAAHSHIEASGVLELEGQVIGGGEFALGDVFAFAGETPHEAAAKNCAEADSCLRLILSFAGDNALYVGGRNTGLLPLGDNQTDGLPPQGSQFPPVLPSMRNGASGDLRWEWAMPLAPRLTTILGSLYNAAVSGGASFVGASARESARYLARVCWFVIPDVWSVPLSVFGVSGLQFWSYPRSPAQGGGAADLDLVSHFVRGAYRAGHRWYREASTALYDKGT